MSTTTTTTTRDRGDRYGPMEWAQEAMCDLYPGPKEEAAMQHLAGVMSNFPCFAHVTTVLFDYTANDQTRPNPVNSYLFLPQTTT